MAGTLGGECSKLDTVVFTCCDMLVACDLAHDLERATRWCQVADQFIRDYGCPFLYARCRTIYGGLLVATGRWSDGERELLAAIEMSTGAGEAVAADAVARMAELRLRQGRIEDASALLRDHEDQARAAEGGERLEVALALFTRLGMPHEAAVARLDLARLLAMSRPEAAVGEAEAALATFMRIGAEADADAAAALLRTLGVASRSGRRRTGDLTDRERQVLRLVALGLSNPEIAARLHISRKTAAHHVSNVLTKLGVRNRTEAVGHLPLTAASPST